MPRPPSKSGQTRDQLFRIAKTLAYNKTAFSNATGLSYWKSRKLVDQLRERKPLKEVFRSEKKLAEYQDAVEQSGYTFRDQRFKGKKRTVAIPPQPTEGRYAKKVSSKKFANATRTSYEYKAGQKIRYKPTDRLQIRAIGKGKSQGQEIKSLFSNVGDWTMAWSSLIEESRRTGFTARKFEVVVIR